MVKAIEGDEYDSESDRTAKIGYSLQKIIDDIEKFLIIILISIIFDTTKEALVCMLVISLTRKFMGGMHMTTWFGCTMMTTMVYSLAIIGGKIFHFSLLMQSASILLLEIIEAILVVCKKSILPDIKKGGEKNVW